MEFISSLVGSLAWPLAVVGVLYLFRGTIKELLAGPLESLQVGPASAKWHRVSDATRSALPPLPQVPPGGAELDYADVPRQPDLTTELRLLAEEQPVEALLQAYDRLEEALRRKMKDAVPEERGLDRADAVGLVRGGREVGTFNDATVRAVEGVSVLRNLAVHGTVRNMTTEQALDYISLIEATLYAVNAPTAPPKA